MTINKYFQTGNSQGTSSEQDLAESNLIEMIQAMGFEFKYIPRTLFNQDEFFREDPNGKFESYHTIEMYMNEPLNFGGQGDLFSKFGLDFTQQLSLVVSRKRFLQETNKQQPDEGDLIYFPLPKILFHIDLVEDEPLENFYSLSKLYTMVLKCSVFTLSHEEIDTGITDIDTDVTPELQDRDFDRHAVINNEANDYVDTITEENIFGTPTESDIT